jgi:hypothetical protein
LHDARENDVQETQVNRHMPPVSLAKKITASAVVIVGLTALALLAGAGLASTGSSSSAAYQYGHKVTICHRTHSKKHPFVTISVDQHALKAHLKHGDSVGPCSSPSSVASKAKRAAKAKAAKAARAKHANKGKHHGSAPSGGGSSAPAPAHGNSSAAHGQSGAHGNSGGSHGKGHGKP